MSFVFSISSVVTLTVHQRGLDDELPQPYGFHPSRHSCSQRILSLLPVFGPSSERVNSHRLQPTENLNMLGFLQRRPRGYGNKPKEHPWTFYPIPGFRAERMTKHDPDPQPTGYPFKEETFPKDLAWNRWQIFWGGVVGVWGWGGWGGGDT